MSHSVQNDAIVTRILETKNFYDILELSSDATHDDIKAAHKKMALQVHPDKNSHPRAKDAFVAVRKATAVLLDKGKRQEYDDYLKSPRGFMTDQFDLSDDAIDNILVGAGVASVAGIALGLWALYEWWTTPKKKENEPKYAR